MSEFSQAPTDNPERRAATLAASRTSGRTPFTCQGTYLMLTPLVRTLDRLGFQHLGCCPTCHQPPNLRECSAAFDPDSLRITVKSELIRARFYARYFPASHVRRVALPKAGPAIHLNL